MAQPTKIKFPGDKKEQQSTEGKPGLTAVPLGKEVWPSSSPSLTNFPGCCRCAAPYSGGAAPRGVLKAREHSLPDLRAALRCIRTGKLARTGLSAQSNTSQERDATARNVTTMLAAVRVAQRPAQEKSRFPSILHWPDLTCWAR